MNLIIKMKVDKIALRAEIRFSQIKHSKIKLQTLTAIILPNIVNQETV